MFRTWLTTLLLFTLASTFGQQIPYSPSSEDELVSSYDYLYNNPISLNDCNEAELSQIQFLSNELVQAFFEYRTKNGPFIHLFELQVIPGWDLSICRKIASFVIVNKTTNSALSFNKSFALLRFEETIEKAAGFLNSSKSNSYQGNKWKELLRFKNTGHPNIQFGFITQKDPGESNFLDFTSAYIQLKPPRIVNKLILGDFSLQWGQGLIQAGGFSLGKTFESIKSTQKFHLGGLPYTSSAEYSFNRGLYVSKNISTFLHWQFFISRKFLDAKIYQLDSQIGFRSIDTDGYHRNQTELDNKSTVQEFKYGNSLQIQLNAHHQAQLNMTHTRYSPDKLLSNLEYKSNEWAGHGFQLYSLSLSSQMNHIRMVEEFAIQSNNKFSFVQGAVWASSKKVDYSYFFRYFSGGFNNPDGKALGENTKNENEIGLFLGNQWQFNKRKRLSSYLDIFYFPEIKYQVSKPKTLGWEFLSRYQMERKGQFQFFNQVKWTSKQEDLSKYQLQRTHDIQETLDINFTKRRKLAFHSRLSIHAIRKDFQNQLGLMLLQDIQLNHSSFQINGRIAYIHTPNYDTRIYVYEQGVPNSFGLFTYYGHAIRMATVIDWRLHKNIRLSTKIGRIVYFDRKEIGSGTDPIAGNHKTDLSLQLIYQNL